MTTSQPQAAGAAIASQKETLALRIVDEQWARNPSFVQRYGASGHAKCVQDVGYNLAYLSEAITADSPALFAAYIDWIKVLFTGLHIPTRELAESLEITAELLPTYFPDGPADPIQRFIDVGLRQLEQGPAVVPSFIDASSAQFGLVRQYMDALLRGDRPAASSLILNAVAEGASIREIYLRVFQPCQHELGRLWQMNQLTVAQEHYCTAATQLIMSQLYAHIFDAPRNGRCLVAAGVGGELHEIGLRMVTDFFEMDGWNTYYLGSNMPANGVVQAVIDRRADALAVTATMAFHVHLVTDLIGRVRQAVSDRPLTILVGGYPFNVEAGLWRQVGADGSAPNAAEAVAAATALLNGAPDA